jgi:hypothetical protein
MAEALNRNDAIGGTPTPPPGEPSAFLSKREEPELLVTPPRRQAPPQHANRFLVAYLVLGIVIGATVIGFAALMMRGEEPAAAKWSTWQPTTNGSERVREIADHVAAGYRLPSGRQLAAAIPRSPKAIDPPVVAVAVDAQTLFDNEQPFKTFPLDDGLMYFLCGSGEQCSIAEGQPTLERHRLLRREALELALHTFRYVDGVDAVVTFLPPRADEVAQQAQQAEQEPLPTTAVYFRKADLKPLIDRPLTETLRGYPVSELMSREQARMIDKHTLRSLYRFSFQQAPDGQSSILVLSPLQG